jgi:rubredoxin
MEGEAYLKGNGYYFRDWEDSLKNGLEETNYKHITGDTHKMATYDQLKEEITAKVVATLTEKLKGKQHKIDADKDGEITAKDFELLRKDESVEEVNEEEEIEERKKRDTPRDSDRREPEKLKMNEEEQLEEMHCGGKRHDDLEPGMRCPMCGHVVMAEAEELEEYGSAGYGEYLSGYDSKEQMDAAQARAEKAEKERKAKKARTPGKTLEENEELEEAQKKEVVEETISNDEWYQSELFESLKKRWTK